jgi:hypothetical protein
MIQVTDELEMKHSPEDLTLRHGETDTFHLEITNTGDRNLRVFMRYRELECSGGSRGTITPSYLELDPGETKAVTVDVRSDAHTFWGCDLGDSEIDLSWGPNLTVNDNNRFDRDTAEGTEMVTLELHHDPTVGYVIIGAIVASLGVMVVWAMKWRKRGGLKPGRGMYDRRE